MYNLFLDDFRRPTDPGDYMPVQLRWWYRNKEWEVAKNYDQFCSIIERLGLPEMVSFDHDLADEHYEMGTGKTYDEYKEKTGYHCMQWMIDYILDNKLKLPKVLVHSMNPVGSENIEKLFDNFKKHYKWEGLNEFDTPMDK